MERRKNPFRFIILLGVLLVLGFLVAQGVLSFLKSPVDKNGPVRAFVVQKGEGVSSVADRLEKEKLIRSALVFKYLFDDAKIDAGDYKLSSSMSTPEVIKNLTSGSIDKWVTLLEGWRVEEMASELNKKLNIKDQEFIAAAKKNEGHLFPDTYLFNPDASVDTIIQTLKSNFDKKYNQDLQARIKVKGLSIEQGVVLASIVEREGRSEKVRTQVASILLKRLKMGMALNADATVQYAKDSQKLKSGNLTKFWQPITQADYKNVDSPYNTYLYPGLPPGPICSPSLMSLNAVANADSSTPYIYYYHDSKGNSYYAKTLDEHNTNVAAHP